MGCHQIQHNIIGMMMGVERWAVLLLITRWIWKPRIINILSNCTRTRRRTPGKSQINRGPEWKRTGGEDQERICGRNENAEAGEWRDDGSSRKTGSVVGRYLDTREGPVDQSPKEVIKIDKDKVKAALEKRRKSRGETRKKRDVMDEDDLIEKELEDGVELAVEVEKIKREHRQSWSRNENQDHVKDHEEVGEGNNFGTKGQSSRGFETEGVEEGEMLDDASPMNSRKTKAGSPPDRHLDGKKWHEYMSRLELQL